MSAVAAKRTSASSTGPRRVDLRRCWSVQSRYLTLPVAAASFDVRRTSCRARYADLSISAAPREIEGAAPVLARVSPCGAFGDHVGIEVRDVLGRRGVVDTFQDANANRIAHRIRGRPEWNANVAPHMPVAGQEHDPPINVRTDRPTMTMSRATCARARFWLPRRLSIEPS